MPRVSSNRVKQGDIAACLGITQAAVSRALKCDPRLTAEIIQKVHETAARLGYRKNLLAKSLIKGYSQIIGYYAPTMASGYYQAMLRGIQNTVRAHEHCLMLNMWSDDNVTNDDEENIRVLRDYGSDGLLVVAKTLSVWEKTIHYSLVSEGYPVVFVNTIVDIPGACCVTSNDIAGVELLLQHLLALGHRNIAMAGAQYGHDPFSRRHKAYSDFTRNQNLRSYPVLINELDPGYVMGYIRDFPEVTAFIGIHDTIALNLQTSLEGLGFRVPYHYSVCGYGNDFMHAEQFRVPLTTVEQNGEDIGRIAAASLLEIIRGRTAPGMQTLPVQLVVRASTDRPLNL